MTVADANMNDKILKRLGKPGLFNKKAIAKSYFKSEDSLVGIEGAEREAIQRALVEFGDNKPSFIDYMSGKFDRSDAQWENLFDNERHLADETAELIVEARKELHPNRRVV